MAITLTKDEKAKAKDWLRANPELWVDRPLTYDLEKELVKHAYRHGVFTPAMDKPDISWLDARFDLLIGQLRKEARREP